MNHTHTEREIFIYQLPLAWCDCSTSPVYCLLTHLLTLLTDQDNFYQSTNTSSRTKRLNRASGKQLSRSKPVRQEVIKMSSEGCLRGVCKFVSEFIRLIMFFASIVFMFVSVFLFAKSFQGKYTYNTLEISNTDSCFIVILALAIYLIALSVLGIHATFFHQGTSLEWFSLLAGMNVLLGLAVYMYTAPRLGDSSMQINRKLTDLQPKYDWTASIEKMINYGTEDQIDATRKWDVIQWTHKCCGVQSPNDWLRFRPYNWMMIGDLPISCCFDLDEENRCSRVNSWTVGCSSQIEAENGNVSVLLSSVIFMNLLLSIMGNLVICCRPKKGYLVF